MSRDISPDKVSRGPTCGLGGIPTVSRPKFLETHIFYAPLRGATFNLDAFEERLGGLTDGKLEIHAAAVPEKWRADDGFCEKIADYLREAGEERGKFLSFINISCDENRLQLPDPPLRA